MPSFQALLDLACKTYKSIDANLNKVVYSRLASLLAGILVNKVCLIVICFNYIRTPVTQIKSTILMKIGCWETHIYLKLVSVDLKAWADIYARIVWFDL